MPFGGGSSETPRRVREIRLERVREDLWQAGATGEREARGARKKHRGERCAERVVCGLRNRLERRLQRERLSKRGSNAEEAALHTGLAGPRIEGLRVRKRKRCDAGKSLEQVGVVLVEAPRTTSPDADDALHVAAGQHRRDERGPETGVRLVRNRLLRGAVFVVRHRAARLERAAGQPGLRRKLEADEALGKAVHGFATEDVSVGVEQEAVGRIGLQQLGDLLDEPLQDRVELEDACQRLCRL